MDGVGSGVAERLNDEFPGLFVGPICPPFWNTVLTVRSTMTMSQLASPVSVPARELTTTAELHNIIYKI